MNNIKQAYKKYKLGYLKHLRKLGYGSHSGDFNLFFIKRAFILCWNKPGFHYFWRYWNPGISFLTFKLFHKLGGNHNKFFAIILTFIINGLIHNLIVYPFLGWSFTLPITFLCFGIFTVLSYNSEPFCIKKTGIGLLILL